MPVLIVVVVLIVIVVAMYNSLQTEKNKVENAWSQIDVELQRRFDLIPNLIETVKGYMAHEKELLTQVTDLRSSWTSAQTVADKSKLNGDLSSTLKSIMAISESYPDLKANQNFIALQQELSNTENKIASTRQFYNAAVTSYNTKLEVIPTNIVGSLFGFKQRELFNVESEEVRKNVKVDFS